MKVIIHTLLDETHIGDNNQAKAVANALKKSMEGQGLTVEGQESVFKKEETQDALRQLDDELEHIVVCAGRQGLEAVNDLKKEFPNVLFIASAHQHFACLDDLEVLPDVLGLPGAVLSEGQKGTLNKKTKLVQTIGVPHGIDEVALTEAAQAMDIDKSKKMVGIMLPGDAPDESGAMKFFTPDDAATLAKRLYQHVKDTQEVDKDTYFWVTNGPRTGKHDYETGKELTPNPHKTEEMVDAVSFAFTEALQALLTEDGLSPEDNMGFSDFKYGEASAYKPMLHYLIQTKGTYFVSSESTSQVTEASYPAINGVNVIAYRAQSESPSHEKHLLATHKMGFLSVLQENGELLPRKDIELSKTTPATHEIVTAAMGVYSERVAHKVLQVRAHEQQYKPKEERRIGMAKPNEKAASSKDKSYLERARGCLPNTPESVKPYMTKQNGMIAVGAVLAAGVGFFAVKKGYVPNPMSLLPSSTPSPK